MLSKATVLNLRYRDRWGCTGHRLGFRKIICNTFHNSHIPTMGFQPGTRKGPHLVWTIHPSIQKEMTQIWYLAISDKTSTHFVPIQNIWPSTKVECHFDKAFDLRWQLVQQKLSWTGRKHRKSAGEVQWFFYVTAFIPLLPCRCRVKVGRQTNLFWFVLSFKNHLRLSIKSSSRETLWWSWGVRTVARAGEMGGCVGADSSFDSVKLPQQ